MGPEFFQTMMGKRFFEGQLPDLIHQLKRIADKLETQAPRLDGVGMTGFTGMIPSLKEKEVAPFSDQMTEKQAGDFIASILPGAEVVKKEPLPIRLNMVRLTKEEASRYQQEIPAEFFEDSPLCGQVVGVYQICPNEDHLLYITELENGQFWTIGDQEDRLGTLTECINFLLNEFL